MLDSGRRILDAGLWMLDSGHWMLHSGSYALGTRRCCWLVENKIRNSILTLNVTLKRNTERNFHCEKLNYITSSYLGLFSSSWNHPFSKMLLENIGCESFFWSNYRLTVQSSNNVNCSRLNPGEQGKHLTSSIVK